MNKTVGLLFTRSKVKDHKFRNENTPFKQNMQFVEVLAEFERADFFPSSNTLVYNGPGIETSTENCRAYLFKRYLSLVFTSASNQQYLDAPHN
jgi:hypothetical protein